MSEIVKSATIKNTAFWVCLVISIALIVTGFFLPPTEEISGSVLTAVEELFGFATLEVVYHAIRKGIDAMNSTGKYIKVFSEANTVSLSRGFNYQTFKIYNYYGTGRNT